MMPKERTEGAHIDWVHSRYVEKNKPGDPAGGVVFCYTNAVVYLPTPTRN